MKKDQVLVKFCPRCRSTEVGSVPWGIITSGSLDECNSCGFRGMFPETDRANLKKLPVINTHADNPSIERKGKKHTKPHKKD